MATLNRFALALVALLCMSGFGCTSSQTLLRESYRLELSEEVLNNTSKGAFEVRGHWVHSCFLREQEEGHVFHAAVLHKDKLYKVEAACFDPQSESLIAYVPEELRGGQVLFVSHDGGSYFGAHEYWVEYSEEAPDWSQAILLQEGEPGVRLFRVDTPERQQAAETYLSHQAWLKALVEGSPTLRREILKERIAPHAKAFMIALRGLWGYASFGWARAIKNPAMYEDRTWQGVWQHANDIWALEKVFQIFQVDLTEYWKGHLAGSTPTRREVLGIIRRREARMDTRNFQANAEYRACLQQHYAHRMPDTFSWEGLRNPPLQPPAVAPAPGGGPQGHAALPPRLDPPPKRPKPPRIDPPPKKEEPKNPDKRVGRR